MVGNPIKNLPEYTYALPNDNARNLYERIAAKSRWDINRLRITKGSDGSLVPNSRDNTIDQLGLYDQSQIFVKDLGMRTASAFTIDTDDRARAATIMASCLRD